MELKGEKVILRPVKKKDIPLVLLIMFTQGTFPIYYSEKQAKALVENNKKKTAYNFGIWNNNRIVGVIGLEDVIDNNCLVNCDISINDRRNGYATEATKLILEYSRKLKLNVYAWVKPDNTASIRILEKYGVVHGKTETRMIIYKL